MIYACIPTLGNLIDPIITNVDVSLSAPVLGTTPVTTATVISSPIGSIYSSTVTWSPGHSPFEASTVYTATITLTAMEGYKFDENTTFTLNGQEITVTLVGTTTVIVLTCTFPATGSGSSNSYIERSDDTDDEYEQHSDIFQVVNDFTPAPTIKVIASPDTAGIDQTADAELSSITSATLPDDKLPDLKDITGTAPPSSNAAQPNSNWLVSNWLWLLLALIFIICCGFWWFFIYIKRRKDDEDEENKGRK